jgi:hypothetical protein
MSTLALAGSGKPYAAVSTDPAANAEATITVPSIGRGWLVLAVHLTVVQGATQTPLPSLVVKDAAGNTVGSYPGASAAMSVSTTSTFDWFPKAALTAGAGATFNTSPIPEGLVVKPGWTVSTSTAGKGANTDLSVLAMHVIKF